LLRSQRREKPRPSWEKQYGAARRQRRFCFPRWQNRVSYFFDGPVPYLNIMARGSKSKYTDKQKRQAEHIEESYEKRGASKKNGRPTRLANREQANRRRRKERWRTESHLLGQESRPQGIGTARRGLEENRFAPGAESSHAPESFRVGVMENQPGTGRLTLAAFLPPPRRRE
jgi:hypothetical protein